MTDQTSAPRRPTRASAVAGAIALIVVLAAGLTIALMQTMAYSAKADVVVLPSSTLNTGTAASYYETLSQGQIVATFAEVANNARFQRDALNAADVPAARRAGVSTVVSVVPDTSVIMVTVTAGDGATAEKVADAVVSESTSYIATLSDAYRVETVADATGTAKATGPSTSVLISLAIGIAIVSGVIVQQLVYQLLLAFGRRQKTAHRHAKDGDPKAGATARTPLHDDTLAERSLAEVK